MIESEPEAEAPETVTRGPHSPYRTDSSEVPALGSVWLKSLGDTPRVPFSASRTNCSWSTSVLENAMPMAAP